MKKLIPFLLAICLFLTLVGCTGNGETPTNIPEPEIAQNTVKPYLDIIGYSRDGLIAKLQEKGMDAQTAQVTVDAAGLDFNQQALRRAKSNLQTIAYSAKGLEEKLQAEKFSPQQAQYGVEHCGADWNQQALRKAKMYLSLTNFPAENLQSQLLFDGFTQEQAAYGAANAKK